MGGEDLLSNEVCATLPRGAGTSPVASPPPTALGRDSWRPDECKVCLYGLPEDRRTAESVHCCLGFSVRLVFDQRIALWVLVITIVVVIVVVVVF